jgi:hypothetical protein
MKDLKKRKRKFNKINYDNVFLNLKAALIALIIVSALLFLINFSGCFDGNRIDEERNYYLYP